MASQIAHIVYAKKYLEKFPMNEIDQDFFFLGCVFPDIRRIDPRIKRSDTHLKFSPVNLDFSGLNSFEAGWKFHLFCDMRREEILRNKDFYYLQKDDSMKWLHASKMLEDEILYDKYNNWEKITALFNNPPQILLEKSVLRESFELWYAILARYMERKPDQKSIHIFLLKQHNLPGKVDEIVKAVSMIKEDKKAIRIIEEIFEEII